MKSVSLQSRDLPGGSPGASRLDRIARRAVRARLDDIEEGQVVVTENGRHESFGRITDDMPLTAHLSINDPRFYGEIAYGGVIGSGEAYMQGYWDCDELTTLVRILLRNRAALDTMDRGLAKFAAPLRKALHRLNRNTRRGSRRNIAAHYDLGNEFYALWLDRRMMYSSAVFESPDMTLEEAGVAKLDRICRKLRLSPEDHVLEIGTGWGGFAIYAAQNYGCRVTTTTISREQYRYAKRAIAAAGLEDQITVLARDYRDLSGRYDKLVSIEMVEAVGWQYHDVFFKKCSSLLAEDGEMLLQAITIADQQYDRYRRNVDFIRRYIFPGGCLCSITAMCETLTRATDMRVVHAEDIGPHYATTLRHWRERFVSRLDDVRRLGYSEEFVRMWNFYLCYCEGAFIEHVIGDVQMHLIKPRARTDVVGF
ncbi:MAG: cyclopropane-fatty-acyl-phospholipid synthase family protein [Woeseiaceae bacterium]|nr:cyclopropane-fatty-acyl-phospholipid synthase family protein [Woeseiaceae bacterium]